MMPRSVLSEATWSAHSALAEGRKQLAKQGIESAFLDARLLLEAATGLPREHILLNDFELSDDDQHHFFAMLDRRCHYEPVAKIIGKKPFWKHDFFTSSATLDPRPETELMIEAALDHASKTEPLSLLDLGTGTGCILLSLLGELPKATGLGVDLSKESLEVASRNADALKLQSRASFLQSSWLEQVQGTFDLILSNPPYIEEDAILPPEVKYDPSSALFAGADGLDAYRLILSEVSFFMKDNGILILEIGEGQANALIDLAEKENLTLLELRKDLAQIPRTLVFKKKILKGDFS